jgi:LmbE family N-acetylglucosaminyl deacetylase
MTKPPHAPPQAFLERWRSRTVVVLSPHRDDACLSLGGLIKAIGHGVVINLFTRSLTIAQAPVSEVSEEMVERIREEEDRKFIEHCNLERHEFRLPEPPLEGRYEFDASYIETDVERLTPPLISKLTQIGELQAREKAILFCPCGIGGHVNHLATLETVLRNSGALARSYELMFYEDLPYASRARRRWAGIARLHQRVAPAILTRDIYIPEWNEKKGLVDLYASQFPRSLSRRRLRPFAPWPLLPHEAFWTITDPGRGDRNRK